MENQLTEDLIPELEKYIKEYSNNNSRSENGNILDRFEGVSRFSNPDEKKIESVKIVESNLALNKVLEIEGIADLTVKFIKTWEVDKLSSTTGVYSVKFRVEYNSEHKEFSNLKLT